MCGSAENAKQDQRSPEQKLLDFLEVLASPYGARQRTMPCPWYGEVVATLRKVMEERLMWRDRAEHRLDELTQERKAREEAEKELRIVTRQRDDWQKITEEHRQERLKAEVDRDRFRQERDKACQERDKACQGRDELLRLQAALSKEGAKACQERDEWQKRAEERLQERDRLKIAADDFESFWRCDAEGERDRALADLTAARTEVEKLTRHLRTTKAREQASDKERDALASGMAKRIERAERALKRAGYVDNGGEEWKPPVGPKCEAADFERWYEEARKVLIGAGYTLTGDRWWKRVGPPPMLHVFRTPWGDVTCPSRDAIQWIDDQVGELEKLRRQRRGDIDALKTDVGRAAAERGALRDVATSAIKTALEAVGRLK